MIYDKLKKLDRLPMHMPGHKRNSALAPYLGALGAEMDITEIDGYDNLHGADGIIAECMQRAAALWGSKKAHLLINGSTCGILAAIRTMTRRGDKVLVTRGAHKSVFHAIELCGLEPVFYVPPVLGRLDIFGSTPADMIGQQLSVHPDIRLIIVTSPTYEGIISDIAAICSEAHSRNIPVMVDEAHGAHLGLGGGFCGGAIKSGADIVIHSLHKTLPSLTQTAMLHVGSDRVDTDRLSHQLAVFQTSSPSYLLMASIDGCIRLLEEKKGLLTGWSTALADFDNQIAPLEKLRVIGHRTDAAICTDSGCVDTASEEASDNGCSVSGAYAFDRSKLPIFTGYSDISGYELAEMLRGEFAIEPEYASANIVLCMSGFGDTPQTLTQLADALIAIDRRCGSSEPKHGMPVTDLLMNTELAVHPEKALELPAQLLPVDSSVGRICAEYIWAYPPGIPLLIPGERIPRQFCELIKHPDAPELHSTSGKIPVYIRALS